MDEWDKNIALTLLLGGFWSRPDDFLKDKPSYWAQYMTHGVEFCGLCHADLIITVVPSSIKIYEVLGMPRNYEFCG